MQRKQTPTSWWVSNRSKLARTVRSPQHQHPGSDGSTKSPSTAVLFIAENLVAAVHEMFRPTRMAFSPGSVGLNPSIPVGVVRV